MLLTEPPMRLEPEVAFGSSTARSFGFLALTLLVAMLAVATVVIGASLLPRPTSLIPPDQGVFSVTGSMAWPWREHPTATLLADGRVLVIGGGGSQGEGPVLAELWGPTTGQFSPAGALHYARTGHSATLLPDGRVLVLGGDTEGMNEGQFLPEVWDSATLSFRLPDVWEWNVPGWTERRPLVHAASIQADGRVAIAAYDTEGHAIAGGIWDPTRDYRDVDSIDPMTSLPTARYFGNGTILADGRVLIAGGEDADRNPVASARIWNPRTESFTATGSMTEARVDHSATLLSDGRVLVAGGLARSFVDVGGGLVPGAGALARPLGADLGGGDLRSETEGTLATAEIWDPETGLFSTTGSMFTGTATHASVLLRDGRVLIAGGWRLRDTEVPAEVFELR